MRGGYGAVASLFSDGHVSVAGTRSVPKPKTQGEHSPSTALARAKGSTGCPSSGTEGDHDEGVVVESVQGYLAPKSEVPL